MKQGKQERKELNRLFYAYKESNKEMMDVAKTFVPTLYFIFTNNNARSGDPTEIFYPIDIEKVNTEDEMDKTFDQMLSKMSEPSYTFEMMMYAQTVEIEGKNEILFGATDVNGYTIHSMLDRQVEHMDKWDKESRDEFLDIVKKRFIIANSMEKITKKN